MQPVISVEGALCRVGRHCVLEVGGLRLGAGEHWTLLGGNGSGKSVLAGLLAGRRRESVLYVRYRVGFEPGRDVSIVSFEEQQRLWRLEQRRDISEFSETAQDVGTEVVRCVTGGQTATVIPASLVPKTGGIQNESRRKAVPLQQERVGQGLLRELLDVLGLRGLGGRGIRYLSSGEMRRVMLGRALYSQHRQHRQHGQSAGRVILLILDEPLESLDRDSREPIAEALARFLLPGTITLRLCRRFDDILPGGTHLALMKPAGERLGIAAWGEHEEMLGSEGVQRFRRHRPPVPRWPVEMGVGVGEGLLPDGEGLSGGPPTGAAAGYALAPPTPPQGGSDTDPPTGSAASACGGQRDALVLPTPPQGGSDTVSRIERADSLTKAPTPLIELRGVSGGYGGRRLFEDLRWCLRKGEHVLVEGPNGCGKSTLLGLISGDNHQGYGQPLFLFGRRKGSGESLWEVKAKFGIVSNELHNRYVKGWRVGAVVVSGFYDSEGLYDDSGPQEAAEAGKWLALCGLAAKAGHYYHELSFGEQRLVLLARAMVKRPAVLIMDEPCVGLDDYHRRRILDLLDLIAARCPTQLIYVSHRRGEHPACINRRLEFRPTGDGPSEVIQSAV